MLKSRMPMKVALVFKVLLIIGAILLQQVEKSYCMFIKKNTVLSFWIECTTSRDASSSTNIQNYSRQQEWQNVT